MVVLSSLPSRNHHASPRCSCKKHCNIHGRRVIQVARHTLKTVKETTWETQHSSHSFVVFVEPPWETGSGAVNSWRCLRKTTTMMTLSCLLRVTRSPFCFFPLLGATTLNNSSKNKIDSKIRMTYPLLFMINRYK